MPAISWPIWECNTNRTYANRSPTPLKKGAFRIPPLKRGARGDLSSGKHGDTVPTMALTKNCMSFTFSRTVCFKDTDAAGVVYFTNVLSMCHEAYEASLALTGIDLKVFFSHTFKQNPIAIPIVHASVDFRRPMYCGDRLLVELFPQQLSEHSFAIDYKIFAEGDRSVKMPDISCQVLSKATTKHTCIDPVARSKQDLPPEIKQWLQRWST
jgi:1,4-dihydroxy-2-naphthoyl-CoA hydrolase